MFECSIHIIGTDNPVLIEGECVCSTGILTQPIVRG